MVDAIQGETSYTVFKLKGCQKEVGVNLQFVCLRVQMIPTIGRGEGDRDNYDNFWSYCEFG